ncbi:MAG: N-acetylmuramoyl-L-alanine amidase [Fibrobacter sp.]|nr:N-acetylmuramoyl-L-alanine amidase [Fibrobacter sp.]
MKNQKEGFHSCLGNVVNMVMVRFFFALFLIAASSTATAARIAFQKGSSGKVDSITCWQINNVSYISLAELAVSLGYSLDWDRYSQKLHCSKAGIDLEFEQDIPLVLKKGVAAQLCCAPVRVGEGLYLPVNAALECFNNPQDNLSLNSTGTRIIGNPSRYSVSSVVCEKKQNGNLLTVILSDSLQFDYTYFYPNFTINFFGGTIDTAAIASAGECGLVKMLRGIQHKGSAQISLLLTKEIEEPILDYIQDTKTLMISLKQEKKKPQPEAVPSLQTDSIKTIVIDPGHGGKDPGAIGPGGVKEKDVALAIALEVRSLLKKAGNITVYLTRDKDIFIPLADRTKFANDKKADLFISIHANSLSGTNARKEAIRGYKMYFLSQAKNEEDKLVAMAENAVIELEERPQNYSNLQNVLIDLVGNEYLRESQDFSIILDQKFSYGLKNKIPKLHLGIGQANFWVLNGAFMPSVLIETGFLSNSSEEKLLSDPKNQKLIAKSVYDAIISFKKRYESGL